MQRTYLAFFGIACLMLAAGCGRAKVDSETDLAKPVGKVLVPQSPLGLPPVPLPADNPVTAETVALGRRLFYEKRLSSDTSLSCASCHNPLIGFSDGRKQSVGVGGKVGVRNAPSVVNAAFTPRQFWDGRAPSLEEQAGGPMSSASEMNQKHEVTISRLKDDLTYQASVERAFGPGPITIGKIKKALASFERTLVSGNSSFDRYEYGGEASALSASAIRGLALFRDERKGNCASCHTIGKNFALFTDGKFHNIGVGISGEGDLTDLGRYGETKQEIERGAFKTPTLRNIAKTSPYMHDGSLATLAGVVAYYAGGGNSNPNLDARMKNMQISSAERVDLVAFLESLTGDMPPNAGPPEHFGPETAR